MTFKLSPEITLPASAPTSTFAFLGTRRYGKTYAAGVMIEEFLAAGVQCVIIDPVGSWCALRLDADGKKKGISIPVFGGEHGDVPLEHTAGRLVAKLIVDKRLSVVLDLSDMTEGQQRRFVTDFAKELFQLKKRNKSPMHLVFEECHEFFPQFVDSSQAEMVGATKRLWKIGGNLGLGGSLISQRAAEVNKGALNLSDTIVTTRLKAPEDVKRIRDWANSNGVSDEAIAKLPTLPKHRVIVWNEEGTAVETTFRKKKTFDSSRTPEEGDLRPVAELPKIDLDEIQKAIAATVDEEVARKSSKVDSDQIRKLNTALQAELADLKNRRPQPVEPQVIYKIPEHVEATLKSVAETMATIRNKDVEHAKTIDHLHRTVVTNLAKLVLNNKKIRHVGPKQLPIKHVGARQPMIILTKKVDSQTESSGEKLPPGAQRMLAALKNSLSPSLHQTNVAMISGMRITGTFSTYKSILNKRGYINTDGGMMTITDEGRRYDIQIDTPKTPQEIVNYWKRQLPDKCAVMINFVIEHGRATQAEMANAADMTESGTFSTYKSKIVSAGLIVKVGQGVYEPAPDLKQS
jgi:uncharacterized protein